MRKFIFSPSFLYLLPILMMLVVLNGCTKKLTKTDVVYENDFERLGQVSVKIFDIYGPVITSKIFDFNSSKVLGPFNNNAAIFKAKNIPDHMIWLGMILSDGEKIFVATCASHTHIFSV